MNIDKMLVVGMGQMGSGIAQVCAVAGCKTYVWDANPEAVKKGMANIDKFLSRHVEKGKLTAEQKNAVMSSLTPVSSLEEAKDADLVIEAIAEIMEAKQSVHKQLDSILKPECILASCTSALPITVMASVTKRQNKFIGIHFHNPVPVMELVEVIRGVETDEETYQTTKEFCLSVKKIPVMVKDVPGFITNRVKIPECVEAIRCAAEGVATVEDIDIAFKAGFGYPLGPLELCDFVGLDTMVHIMDDLYKSYADTRFFAPPMIRQLVSLGYLGRKTGRGFYDYSKKTK
jgi:3-hydroxybutyryl-CoA dehydrogenase